MKTNTSNTHDESRSIGDGVTIQDIAHVFQSERRCAVIRHLHGNQELNVREIAKRIAADETGKTDVQTDWDEYKRVYISLYQNHIETLEACGAVDDPDGRRDVIEPGENFVAFVDALRALEDATEGR